MIAGVLPLTLKGRIHRNNSEDKKSAADPNTGNHRWNLDPGAEERD
jgi:hypothetical protein